MYSYVQSDGQVRGTYGRGWVVVAGSFAVHVFVFGVSYTYGILVPSLVDHFDSGRAVVGGVSSLMIGLSWTAGTCTTCLPILQAFISRSPLRLALRYCFQQRHAIRTACGCAWCGYVCASVCLSLIMVTPKLGRKHTYYTASKTFTSFSSRRLMQRRNYFSSRSLVLN